MRCKKHPGDLSSSVGVCASCLRERLFAFMAAQARAQTQAQAQAQQDCRKSHTVQQPMPLSFPRSVSPYISRRKSDAGAATWQLHRLQHSTTPLVGPTGSAQLETRKAEVKGSRGGGRFSSLFLGLFRPKTKTGSGSGPGVPAASPSWFSAMVPGRRRKQDRAFWLGEGASGARWKSGRDRDRGMSPDDEHCHGGRSSGYSSESSQGWRQTPARRGAGHSRDVSGFGFCLSPLVRPSPHRHWNQKGMPPEKVAAGESRVPAKARLSTAASFCKNRSRKLADFGRYSYNTNH